MATAYDFTARDIDGGERALREFAGQALLIVNVASKCGFTPQYAGLEALWRKRRDAGLAVLGFPCDQFGHQEPGDEAEIKQFCSLNYDVTFPLFAKIEVNGAGAHPLYRWLKSGTARRARHRGDQVELHQVPRRSLGPRRQALCAERHAREDRRGRGEGAGRAAERLTVSARLTPRGVSSAILPGAVSRASA